MTDRERYKFIMKDCKHILKGGTRKVPKIKATMSQLINFVEHTDNKYFKYRLQGKFVDLYFLLKEIDETELNKLLKFKGLT